MQPQDVANLVQLGTSKPDPAVRHCSVEAIHRYRLIERVRAGNLHGLARIQCRCRQGTLGPILRFFFAVASLTILLARCSILPGTSGLSGPTPTPATPAHLDVAYSAISGGELPLWMTKQAGLFEQHGLDVSLQLIPGGNNSMAALLSGHVQIAEAGGSDALAADVNGADVVVIATNEPVYPYELIVAPAIKTAADLRGKKLAAGARGSSGDVALRVALRKLG